MNVAKQHSHKTTASGQARLDYLEIQLAAVANVEKKIQTETIQAQVHSQGQKLFYNSSVGSLITGDTSKLTKFKTVFNASQFFNMFIYHVVGLFSLPFAIRRYGRKFTKVIGLVPCFATLPAFAWFCRILMIALKYAYVSRYELETVIKHIDIPKYFQEWFSWHISVWATQPEIALEKEIKMAAIRKGTSEMDPKYNFVFHGYSNVEAAKIHARSINKGLGYVSCKKDGTKMYARNAQHNNNAEEEQEQQQEQQQEEEEEGLVTFTQTRTSQDKNCLCPAHVLIQRENNRNEPNMIKNEHGKLVDSTISVHLFGTDVVKACMIQGHKELLSERSQNPRNTSPRCLAFLLIFLPPLLFVFLPVNTIQEFKEQESEQVIKTNNNVSDVSVPGVPGVHESLCCVSNKTYCDTIPYNASSQIEYRSYYYYDDEATSATKPRNHIWIGFKYNLQWFLCLAPPAKSVHHMNLSYLRYIFIGGFVLVLFNSFFLFKTLFMFLEHGQNIFERHYRAMRFLNTLIQQSLMVNKYDQMQAGGVPSHQYLFSMAPKTLPIVTKLPPILCLCHPQRSTTYMYVQELLRDVGIAYSLRLQILAGASGLFLLVLTAISLLQGYIMDSATEIPISILASFLIFFGIVVYYLYSMIQGAGNMNLQTETNARTLLDLEKKLILSFENGSELSSSKIRVAILALRDCRLMMKEQYISNPVTFFGLVAGPKLYSTIATLVVTAGSSLISKVGK